jgi:nicotinate-nucleotide adenylyltransferase
VGADAFRGLPQWNHWRDLFGLAHLVVAVRPGHGLDDLPEALALASAGRWTDRPSDLLAAPAGRLMALHMPLHPASATQLRAWLRAGQPHGDWLPAPVADFIRAQGLYRGGTGPAGV